MSHSLRRDLIDGALFELEDDSFQSAAMGLLERYDLSTERVNKGVPTGWGGPPEMVGADDEDENSNGNEFETLSETEQRLVWRIWALGDLPVGLVVAGPVYQDNPILYANRTFRRLTGYTLADVRGENLRLLQGPETDPGPVEDLREALDIWTPVTVELQNYRKDGTPFRNRVSLVPVDDGSGTITNWIGIQAVVGDSDATDSD